MFVLHDANDSITEQNGIVTGIDYEDIITVVKGKHFCQHMIYFVNTLELKIMDINKMELQLREIIREGSYFP